jgi:hypothetical protein
MLVDVDVTGIDETDERFKDIIRRATDPRPALRSVSDYLAGEERKVFFTQGGSIGVSWPAPSKRKQEKGGRPGVDTGAMFKTLTLKRPAGGTRQMTRTGLTFGTRLFYARFFVKQRPLFRRTERVENHARTILRNFILEGQL